MKILFMGTPDFALASLKALCESGENVVGVVTQTDKPKGRGYELTPPPVKEYALEKNIPVYQPKTLKGDDFDALLREIDPDMIIVVAFGKILPENVINYPKYGCINGHASLLPRHRGASPIQWSIVSGDKKTGVTTMLMEKGLDTGDMLLKAETDIGENETGEELHDRLSDMGAKLMLETLRAVENETVTPQKQDDSLHNLIRGFYSWPAAYFMLNGKRIKVLSARLSDKTSAIPGTVIKSDDELVIACGDGNSVSLLEVQAEGSKRMKAADYLKGHSIAKGTVITRG